MTSMKLLAQEVIPLRRAYAKEIDLPGPYERKPGSVNLQAGVSRAPVVDCMPLTALSLV